MTQESERMIYVIYPVFRIGKLRKIEIKQDLRASKIKCPRTWQPALLVDKPDGFTSY